MPIPPVIARAQPPASNLCEPPVAAERPLGLVITLYRQSERGPLYAIALHRRPWRETR
jgi:hypothetical protein